MLQSENGKKTIAQDLRSCSLLLNYHNCKKKVYANYLL